MSLATFERVGVGGDVEAQLGAHVRKAERRAAERLNVFREGGERRRAQPAHLVGRRRRRQLLAGERVGRHLVLLPRRLQQLLEGFLCDQVAARQLDDALAHVEVGEKDWARLIVAEPRTIRRPRA